LSWSFTGARGLDFKECLAVIDPRTRFYVFLLGVAVLIFVINMVRTRQLQERYALLWILAGLSLTISPLAIPWLDTVAYALGFDYPPALLLMVSVIGLLLIVFQLSLTLSRNAETIKVLTQEVGLLREEMGVLETRLSSADVHRADEPSDRGPGQEA
jgi:hypothetical protein